VYYAKNKNTEEADLIIPGKRTQKALSSACLKASVEDAELSSDSNTEALKMMNKARRRQRPPRAQKKAYRKG